MASSNHRWSFWNGIFRSGSGLAVGWLVGLSLSPVLQVVVASIVALTVAATGALAGLSLDAAQPKDGGEPHTQLLWCCGPALPFYRCA